MFSSIHDTCLLSVAMGFSGSSCVSVAALVVLDMEEDGGASTVLLWKRRSSSCRGVGDDEGTGGSGRVLRCASAYVRVNLKNESLSTNGAASLSFVFKTLDNAVSVIEVAYGLRQ